MDNTHVKTPTYLVKYVDAAHESCPVNGNQDILVHLPATQVVQRTMTNETAHKMPHI